MKQTVHLRCLRATAGERAQEWPDCLVSTRQRLLFSVRVHGAPLPMDAASKQPHPGFHPFNSSSERSSDAAQLGTAT